MLRSKTVSLLSIMQYSEDGVEVIGLIRKTRNRISSGVQVWKTLLSCKYSKLKTGVLSLIVYDGKKENIQLTLFDLTDLK